MRARSRTAAVGASGSRGPCGKIRPRGEVPSWPRRPSWDGPRSCPFRGTRSTRRPLAGRNRRRYSRPGGRSRLGSAGEDAPRSRRLAGRADAPAGTETDRARSGALANRARRNLPPPPRGPVPPACRPTDEPPGPPVFQRDPHTRCHRSSSSPEGCGSSLGFRHPGRCVRPGRASPSADGRTRRTQGGPEVRRPFRLGTSRPRLPWSCDAAMMPIGRDGCKTLRAHGVAGRSPNARPRPRSPTSSGARSRASAMAFSERSSSAPFPDVECSRLPAGHTDR